MILKVFWTKQFYDPMILYVITKQKSKRRTVTALVASKGRFPWGIVSSDKSVYEICTQLHFSIEEYAETSQTPGYCQLFKPAKKTSNQNNSQENPTKWKIVCVLGQVYIK